MRFDNHTHSRFSFDGAPDATPDAMCRTAIDRGLDGLAITDHLDINGQVEGIYDWFDHAAQWEAVSQAREAHAGRLRLIRGIELGQPLQYPEQAREILDRYDYDFVLGSLHNLAGVPDFSQLKFEKITVPMMHQLFERSLCDLIDMCDFPGLSALAHITYPYRYMVYCGRGADFDIARHNDQLRVLFRRMIERGLALEMNVSPLRGGYDLTLPDRDVLAIYRACGGELVTVGSDAHRLCDIGANIDDAYARLRDLGFRYVTYYEQRRPRPFPI